MIKELKVPQKRTEWHEWYAWHPVETSGNPNYFVWLDVCERKMFHAFGSSGWVYRLKEQIDE